VGTQRTEDGGENRIEFATEGLLYEKKGCLMVVYEESRDAGLAGVKTLLKVEGQRIVLNRVGTISHKQEFAVNEYHQGNYVTPHGTISMGIKTKAMECDLTAQGGHISLKYNLFVDGQLVSDNELFITIKGLPYH